MVINLSQLTGHVMHQQFNIQDFYILPHCVCVCVCVCVLYLSQNKETFASYNINRLAFIIDINPLNAELNPICYLLALLGAHHFLHVRRIRVKTLTLRLLMSYIYGAPILDISRPHTTPQHSR